MDKTGTLTTGELKVERVESFPPGRELEVARLAYSLEQQPPGLAEAAGRLEPLDGGGRRGGECIPRGRAVTERREVRVQLRNVATRRHPGDEGPPGRNQRDPGTA